MVPREGEGPARRGQGTHCLGPHHQELLAVGVVLVAGGCGFLEGMCQVP